MSPVNVKLPESQLRRLDAGIASGRVGNRSEALRLALERLLREWDQEAWNEAWASAVPDRADGSTSPPAEDEFGELHAAAIDGWSDLDCDR